jgi:exodeoxyribonuclease V alpha subunit
MINIQFQRYFSAFQRPLLNSYALQQLPKSFLSTSSYSSNENHRVELAGTVKRVVYRSQDNLFSILSVQPTNHNRDVSVLGRGAIMGAYLEGQTLQVQGTLKTHKKYGLQVEVTENDAAHSFLSKETKLKYDNVEGNSESVRAYLKNGFIPQVGPATADLLVDHFGNATSEALLSSKRLMKVTGIGKVKANIISKHWKIDTETGIRPSIMYLLSEFNLTFSQAKILLKRYGIAAPDLVKKNPYRLIDDIHGVGFVRADEIARRMGIPINSNERLQSSIGHWLKNSEAIHGHTCMSVEDVCNGATSLLTISDHETNYVPSVKDLRSAIKNLEKSGRCHIDFGNMVYSSAMYNAETLLASSLRSIGESYTERINIDSSEQHENDLSMLASDFNVKDGLSNLSSEQQRAVLLSQTEQLLILTGGPGTGKTFTTRSILREWWSMGIKNIVLTSPTARAARHLGRVATEGKPEDVEKPKSMTIHKLLEYSKHKNRFMRNKNRPIDAEAVVVDECSMLDTVLAASLFSAMRPGTRVLIVGDSDQLPSVGPGNVLRDLVNSETLPVVRLVQIYRQEEASDIVQSAHQFNRGVLPMGSGSMQSLRSHDMRMLTEKLKAQPTSSVTSTSHSALRDDKKEEDKENNSNENVLSISSAFASSNNPDCLWIEENDSSKGSRVICEEIMDYIEARGFSPKEDVQVLSPMHKGNVGTIKLNSVLRSRLNPSAKSNVGYPTELAVGDRCMQETNDYDLNVWNGECGTVVDVRKGLVTVEFNDGDDLNDKRRHVQFNNKQSRSLTLSYACTIHKSQGQEFPVVVVPTYMEHFHMLSRELVYTALTRASKLAIFVGQKRALGGALQRQSAYNRTTGLLRHLAPNPERVSENSWRSKDDFNSKTFTVVEDRNNEFVELFDSLDLEDLVKIDQAKQSTIGAWEKIEDELNENILDIVIKEDVQEETVIATSTNSTISTGSTSSKEFGPWEFESSKGDLTYVAKFNEDTRMLSCNCPGFKYRKSCKHVQKIQNLLSKFN